MAWDDWGDNQEEAPQQPDYLELVDDDGTTFKFDKSQIHTKRDFMEQLTEKRRQRDWLADPERHTPESSTFAPDNPFLSRWWKGGVLPTGEQWQSGLEGVGAGTKQLVEGTANMFKPRVPEGAIHELERLGSGDQPTSISDAAKRAWNASMDTIKSTIPGYETLSGMTQGIWDKATGGDYAGAGKEAVGSISPLPIDPLIKMGRGYGYGLGISDTPISGNEFMHATGEMVAPVAVAAGLAAHSRVSGARALAAREAALAETERLRLSKENPTEISQYGEHEPLGDISPEMPWVDAATRAGVDRELTPSGEPRPAPYQPEPETFVRGGEPGAAEKVYPDIPVEQPAGDTLLSTALRMSRNPEQLLYPREEPTGWERYAAKDEAIRADVAAENARREGPTPESIRRFMGEGAEAQVPAEPGSTRMGFNEQTAAERDIESFRKNRAQKGAPLKARGEMVPGLPEGPDAALYRTIPESLWPRRSQSWLEQMVPEQLKTEPEPPVLPDLPEVGVTRRAGNAGRVLQEGLGPLAEGGVEQTGIPEIEGVPGEVPPVPPDSLPSMETPAPPRLARPLATAPDLEPPPGYGTRMQGGFGEVSTQAPRLPAIETPPPPLRESAMGPPMPPPELPPMGEVTPQFPGEPPAPVGTMPPIEPPPPTGTPNIPGASVGRGAIRMGEKPGSYSAVIDEAASNSLDPEVKKAAEILKEGAAEIEDPSFKGELKKGLGGMLKRSLLESDSHALRSLGEMGTKIEQLFRRKDADAAGFAGELSANIDRVTRGMTKEQLELGANLKEGKATTTDPKVQRYVDVMRENDAKLVELMKKSGSQMRAANGQLVDFKELQNYFPHMFEKGFFETNRTKIIEKIMQDSQKKAARTGNKAMTYNQAEQLLDRARKYSPILSDSLHERVADLEGYKKTPDVLHKHYLDLADRAFTDQHLGVNDTANPTSLINQMLEQVKAESGHDAWAQASDIASKFLKHDPLNVSEGVGQLTKFQALTKLALSAPSNLMGGTAMTAFRAKGILVPEILKAFTTEGRLRAQELGSLESVMKDGAEDVGYGSKISYGNTSVERFLRTVSGLAGEKTVGKLFDQLKNNPDNAYAAKRLGELVLEDPHEVIKQDGLTELQVKRAANRFTDMTQGRQNSLDLPHNWSNEPVANLLTQFKKYAFIQTTNMKNAMMLDWSHGRVTPTLKLALAAGVLGEVPADFKAMVHSGTISGRPDGLERIIDNAANAYGIGLLGDAVSTARSGDKSRALSQLAGPSIDTGVDLLTGAGKSASNVFDMARGEKEWSGEAVAPLARATMRQFVPVWGRDIAKQF